MNRFEKFLLDSKNIEGAATDRCYSKNRRLMGRSAESLAGILLKEDLRCKCHRIAVRIRMRGRRQAEGAPDSADDGCPVHDIWRVWTADEPSQLRQSLFKLGHAME